MYLTPIKVHTFILLVLRGKARMRVLHILYCDFQKVLDYLKMDIERSEWDSLPNMMDDGILNKVKQLGLEIHINTGTVTSFRSTMYHLKKNWKN